MDIREIDYEKVARRVLRAHRAKERRMHMGTRVYCIPVQREKTPDGIVVHFNPNTYEYRLGPGHVFLDVKVTDKLITIVNDLDKDNIVVRKLKISNIEKTLLKT